MPLTILIPPNLLLVDSSGRPVEIFIEFLDKIGNSKTFEANLLNSSGCPVKSYWMSSRNSTGCPLDQMIWAIIMRETQKCSLGTRGSKIGKV